MAVINDDRFIRQNLDNHTSEGIFNQKNYDRSKLAGIGNQDKWEAMQMVSKMFPEKNSQDDSMPLGTMVEFTAPDGTKYNGKIASKSGSDYVVDVSFGESYLVPVQKLSKVTPESEKIKEAMRRYTDPDIKLVAKPSIEIANRCIARVAYKTRRPTEQELVKWSESQYPDWRLVDAVDDSDRHINLIFEIVAQTNSFVDDVTPILDATNGLGVFDLIELHNDGIAIAVDNSDWKKHQEISNILSKINNIAQTHGLKMNNEFDTMWGVMYSWGKVKKTAAEDVKPQGGDQVSRGRPLSSELVEGTGVTADAEWEDQLPGGLADDKDPDDFDPKELEKGVKVEMEHTDDPEIATEITMDHMVENPTSEEPISSDYYEGLDEMEKKLEKASIVTFDDVDPLPTTYTLSDVVKINKRHEAQLGEPGAGEDFKDLLRASRWVLARFNDSNPDYYAVPQESEEAGDNENRVLRLSFILQKKDDEDRLSHLYISRAGEIVPEIEKQPGMEPVRGFVQVDSEGNLPMVMLYTPMGPESVQEYGFDFSANREIEKLADYDACRTLANEVLDKFGGYTSEAQADFDARLVKLAVDPTAKEYWGGYFKDYGKMMTRNIKKKKHKSALKKVAIDENAKRYWIEYFGLIDGAWYGEALVRDIPRRLVGDNTSPHAKKEASSDYEGYIKEEHGKYCVKSKHNKDWSGGCYDTKAEAEKRLKQVETFKHMAKKACAYDGFEPTDDFIGQMTVVGVILDDLIHKSADDIEAVFGRTYPHRRKQPTSTGIPLRDVYNVATWALDVAKKDENMHNAVYSLVYDFLRRYPTFLQNKLDTNQLTEEGVGYTLAYALASSPKAFNSLKKAVNKYHSRWQKGFWREMGDSAKQWREEQKKKPEKEKPSQKSEPTIQLDPEDLQVEDAGPSVDLNDPQTKQTAQSIASSIKSFLKVDKDYLNGEIGMDRVVKQYKHLEDSIGDNKEIYDAIKSPELENKLNERFDFYSKELEKMQGKEQPAAIAQPPKPPSEEKSSIKPPPLPPEAMEEDNPAALLEEPKPKQPFDLRKVSPQQQAGNWLQPSGTTSTSPEEYQMVYAKKKADAAPGPVTHNAPGKDDKKDYDHKDMRKQPSKACTRFEITRMYSTTSSSDNGYIFMELAWDPEYLEDMSDQNIQQQVISYVKGLESNKEFHDFGIMGRVRIVDFDKDAGVARIKVRCSETRGVPTLGYTGDSDSPIPTTGIR